MYWPQICRSLLCWVICLYVLLCHCWRNDQGVKRGIQKHMWLPVERVSVNSLKQPAARTHCAGGEDHMWRSLLWCCSTFHGLCVLFVCVCRLLQDHHSVQSRSNGRVVCWLFHSPLPAYRREGSSHRRYAECTPHRGTDFIAASCKDSLFKVKQPQREMVSDLPI